MCISPSLYTGSFLRTVAKSMLPLLMAAFMLASCDNADTTPDIEDQTDTGTNQTEDCDDDLELCDSYCVDTTASALHCGTCGNQCDEDQICQNGACILWCPTGQSICGDQCRDLNTSQNHCGECDKACPAGFICDNGECTLSCPSPQVACGNKCANLETDSEYCGSCNNSCNDGMVCSQGQCALACGPGLAECSGSCVDINGDRRYCGSCTNQCEQGYVCEEGECILTCPIGMEKCDDTCVNLVTNKNHCGSCGNACPEYALCRDSQCSFPVSGLTLDKVKLSIAVGAQTPLTATVEPENADNPAVAWTSANNGIARVNSEGLITGIAKGETIITAITADGGYQATCLVTVYIAVDEVVVTPATASLAPGGNKPLDVAISPANASNTSVIWTTDNPDVAMVDYEGVVRAIGDGTAIITATSVDGGLTGSCEVTVNSIRVERITISPTSISLNLSDRKTGLIVPSITPNNANNKTVLWHSSHTNVVTVDNSGLVTAVGPGNAVITAITADGGKTATCNVTVTP